MKNLNKTQKRIIIIIAILVVGIIGYYIYGREKDSVDITEEQEMMVKPKENTEENQTGQIVVHITGAVKNEGVVTLKENSRITDAVNAAGGLTEDADMSKINLAYILEDGVKINIPSKNDVTQINPSEESTNDEEIVDAIPESSTKSEGRNTNMVNINKASQTELETLPGIGPSIALKIINYREENGKFSSVEDLRNVNGIGDSKFENIKNLVSVK